MAQGYSIQAKKMIVDGAKVNGIIYQVNTLQFRAVLDLSSADVAKVVADTNILARLPAGLVVDHIRVVSSVSLTTSQLSFGVAGAAAKYGAAKAYGTVAKAAVDWYEPTVMDDEASADKQDILMTVGTADLPGAGIVIVDIFVTARG